MAQDIRDLFEKERELTTHQMPQEHGSRFLSKLDKALPEKKSNSKMNFNWRIAAGFVIFFGLGIGVFNYFQKDTINKTIVSADSEMKTLGDISPDLKKVEDYYLANINIELSKVKLTDENKELFDSYVSRLEDLNKAYESLSVDLTNNGPNELTVNALIDNLKIRLNLLYRLKQQLKELNTTTNTEGTI